MNFGVGTTYLYNSLIHLNIHPNTMYAYYPQSTLVDDYIAASMVYSLYTFTVGIKSLHNSPISIMEKMISIQTSCAGATKQVPMHTVI